MENLRVFCNIYQYLGLYISKIANSHRVIFVSYQQY